MKRIILKYGIGIANRWVEILVPKRILLKEVAHTRGRSPPTSQAP
ncbi:MAG: hypothetical protein AAGA01_05485 [Cyanobacteria bacterium P01_E01_bin.43]